MGTYASTGGSSSQYASSNTGAWNASTVYSGANTASPSQNHSVSSASAVNSLATTSASSNEFEGWTNQKAMDILYTQEGKVDAADGRADKWGTNEGLINIATDTTNKYDAELRTAAKYILGNKELLNKLCGDDGLFGAGCDSDPVTAAAHRFYVADKAYHQNDELYFLSCDANLSSYGGNTTKGFSTTTNNQEMSTYQALSIMYKHRDTLDKADGNSDKWANKAGLQKIITNSGTYDQQLVQAVKHVREANGGKVWGELFNGDDLFATGDFFDAGKARWQNDEMRSMMQKYI